MSETNEEANAKPIKFMSLWEGETKKGDVYFSGYLNQVPIKIFKNLWKTEEKTPDYYGYICPLSTKKKEEKFSRYQKTQEEPIYQDEDFPA